MANSPIRSGNLGDAYSVQQSTNEMYAKKAAEENRRKAEASLELAKQETDLEIFNGMKQTLEKIKFSG